MAKLEYEISKEEFESAWAETIREKEYNYSEVVELTDTGIEFRDGYILKFKTCIKDWAVVRKIPESENTCLGCRNIAALIPYFIFFQDKVLIKIYFQYGGIFGKKRAERTIQSEKGALRFDKR